jgi:hypothetical protein
VFAVRFAHLNAFHKGTTWWQHFAKPGNVIYNSASFKNIIKAPCSPEALNHTLLCTEQCGVVQGEASGQGTLKCKVFLYYIFARIRLTAACLPVGRSGRLAVSFSVPFGNPNVWTSLFFYIRSLTLQQTAGMRSLFILIFGSKMVL